MPIYVKNVFKDFIEIKKKHVKNSKNKNLNFKKNF